MGESLTDFVKQAGLFTLLHFFTTAILLLISIAFFIFARSKRAMWWFLGIGVLPVVSGILAMRLKNRLLDTGIGMFGELSPQAIASGRLEAIIDLGVGAAGTILILLLIQWRWLLNRKTD